jgi:hypothetical protein
MLRSLSDNKGNAEKQEQEQELTFYSTIRLRCPASIVEDDIARFNTENITNNNNLVSIFNFTICPVKVKEAAFVTVKITATYNKLSTKEENQHLDLSVRNALAFLYKHGLSSRGLDEQKTKHEIFLRDNEIESHYQSTVGKQGSSYRPNGNAF